MPTISTSQGCPGARLWVVAELGDEARYIRGDATTEVSRRHLAAHRYGVEVTLAHPDEQGRHTLLLWKLPDLETAATASLQLMAALADDAEGVLQLVFFLPIGVVLCARGVLAHRGLGHRGARGGHRIQRGNSRWRRLNARPPSQPDHD